MSTTLKVTFDSEASTKIFRQSYGTEGIARARRRYHKLNDDMLGLRAHTGPLTNSVGIVFPTLSFTEISDNIRLFSAPGRTELVGNHTDHNNGKVIAAAIQLDCVAIVVKRSDNIVFLRSTNFSDVIVDLGPLDELNQEENAKRALAMKDVEKGKTEALVRGIATVMASRGIKVKGFTAIADSMVLPGSGLSSSACMEVLIGKIFNNLYGGKMSPLEIAQIGQKAENDYFGKNCGLMDQTACASGGLVAIDFREVNNPKVTRKELDLVSVGYVVCVVDTKGSHADLTPDYSAIPNEMKAVAKMFGKGVLREITLEEVLAKANDIRKALGDRALLRAIHFFNENDRVDSMVAAVETIGKVETQGKALEDFLSLVRQSGDSSWELLQNIYSPTNIKEQSIAVALARSRQFFAGVKGPCAARVHGGGFAGTIQTYIPQNYLAEYTKVMEEIFGVGAVTRLGFRSEGAVELSF